MKKILLLLLMIGSFAQAQNVNIPDANFKARLLQASPSNQVAYGGGAYMKIDANDDGEIQVSEAIVVDSLQVGAANVTDLTGVLSFSNLKKIDFSWNSVAGPVDLTTLTNLREIESSMNPVTSLNIAGLSNLTVLRCYNNQLTSLDFTGINSLVELQCGGNQISSLNVLGQLNLKTLSCGYNLLTVLDVTGLVNLEMLDCYNNQLIALDASTNNNLKSLYCGANQLNALNVSGLSNLMYLNFDNTTVSSVSLAGLTSLESLSCNSNQLSVLNLNGLNSLRTLSCTNNQLTALDFTGCLSLEIVFCDNNQLNTLDFSGNPVFADLNCSNNNISYINLKNGFNHTLWDDFWDNNNLSAFFVCIDEGERADVEWIISHSNMNHAVLTTYCSFTPGGNYNTITGNVIYDIANDGCDVADLPQPFIKVKINDGTTEGASFVNASANYVFYTQAGNFTVTPDMENSSFFNFSPVNTVINFPDNNNNVVTQNFCVTANGVHPDLEVVIAPVTPLARPGFDAWYKIVYKNKGNQLLSGNVVLDFNDAVLDLVSSLPMPDIQTTGQYTFNFTNLLPFENREIGIVFNVNSPVDTPPVNSGDILDFTVSVNPTVGDETPNDNQFVYSQTVVNACDPNDKYCLEGEVESPVKIGEYLHYIINFENIGTADAVNVVVKDVIDTTKFDEKSLQIMNSSHPVEAKINGNVAEFVFQNINLAHNGNGGGGGHGNILLKIKTKANLEVGDIATNKADIFFDYNAPIETNLASTVFQSLGVNENVIDNSVFIYPNPTSDKVSVKSNNTIKSIQLFDVQGRLLFTRIAAELTENIDLSSKATGVYFMKIITTQGIKIEKILKK